MSRLFQVCFQIIRDLQLNACSDGIRLKRCLIDLFKSYRMACNNLINNQTQASYLHLIEGTQLRAIYVKFAALMKKWTVKSVL
jgi:hypothetical protein